MLRPASELPIEIFDYDREHDKLSTAMDKILPYGYLPTGLKIVSPKRTVAFWCCSNDEHHNAYGNYQYKSQEDDIKTRVVVYK